MPRLANLGSALRLLRREKGWTQATVASRAGVSVSMLSHFESGRRSPTVESLGRLLDALEVDLGPFDGVLERVNGRPAIRPGRCTSRRSRRRVVLTPETVAQALGLERSSDRRVARTQDRLLKAVQLLVDVWPSPNGGRSSGPSGPKASSSRKPEEPGDGPL